MEAVIVLRLMDELRGYTLGALDGDIGSVSDFFFDDEHWVVRYLVVDTGGWLSGRRVLISPIALGEADWQAERLSVALTREQIERSPGIDTHKPVSRRHEAEYAGYYGWPYYWGGGGLWGPYAYPYQMTMAVPPPAAAVQPGQGDDAAEAEEPEDPEDAHLRSASEVAGFTGYRIRALDDEIGHVADFILDDETWAVRYLVVDTGTWLPGKKVLIAPQWIARVSWEQAQVDVDLPRAAIERSPEFDPSMPVNRQYEARLYDFYGRPVYWA